MPVEKNNEIEKGKNSVMDKAIYFGLGLASGVLLFPILKKGIEKYAPMANELLGSALGKAESCVEDASDLMAKVKKDYLKKTEDNLSPNDKSESCTSKGSSQSDTCSANLSS